MPVFLARRNRTCPSSPVSGRVVPASGGGGADRSPATSTLPAGREELPPVLCGDSTRRPPCVGGSSCVRSVAREDGRRDVGPRLEDALPAKSPRPTRCGGPGTDGSPPAPVVASDV